MLREMIRAELRRTGECDPGRNNVKLAHLEIMWRYSDRRELVHRLGSVEEEELDMLWRQYDQVLTEYVHRTDHQNHMDIDQVEE